MTCAVAINPNPVAINCANGNTVQLTGAVTTTLQTYTTQWSFVGSQVDHIQLSNDMTSLSLTLKASANVPPFQLQLTATGSMPQVCLTYFLNIHKWSLLDRLLHQPLVQALSRSLQSRFNFPRIHPSTNQSVSSLRATRNFSNFLDYPHHGSVSRLSTLTVDL